MYNGEKFLADTLDNLLGQSLREIEIICVDDGSEDWSLEILKKFGYEGKYANSDEFITRLFFLNCNKVTFFYRQGNPEAITKKMSAKRFEWLLINFDILALISKDDKQLFSKDELIRIKAILSESWLKQLKWSLNYRMYKVALKTILLRSV